ncbi:MAG TPA: lipopolysaccharide transport periplasmic protein LptA [Leucothrix sp.]|nr:lipopolysaccharide transport periplasmic protein LptA [Leucothrix sp.]
MLLKTALTTLFLVFTSSVMALKGDVEKPVYISADSVVFNKAKGFAIYEGHVSIVQGTLEIKASKIEINAPKNEISKITATGSPVSFQQKMDDGKFAKGKANRVIYLIKDKRLFLDGNAVISQGNDKFSSNHIDYSIRNGELKAGNKKAPGKSRVNVIFYPTNKAK